MKTKDELQNDYLIAVEDIDAENTIEGVACAIALAIPFFLELLADIRDALIEIDINTKRT